VQHLVPLASRSCPAQEPENEAREICQWPSGVACAASVPFGAELKLSTCVTPWRGGRALIAPAMRPDDSPAISADSRTIAVS
jgi:hypothetical protein